MGIEMLKPLVSLEDMATDVIAAKDDGLITENEAKMLLAYRTGRIAQIGAADAWALRIRLTERTRQSMAWKIGRHYEEMASTLRHLVARDGAQGVTFQTTEGTKFAGTVLAVAPYDDGSFTINPEIGDVGRDRVFHFDEIPVGYFGTYNR